MAAMNDPRGRDRYERRAGEPLLLIQGLGYGRWGWDPVVPGLARALPRR